MKSSFEQPSLFGDDQADLFGAAFKPHVPKERHVRNALTRIVGEMEAVDSWPWPRSTTKNYREHWLEYLCGHIADKAEADEWRERIAGNFTRLEAAEKEAAA